METSENKAPEQVEQKEPQQGIDPNEPVNKAEMDPAFQRVLDAKKELLYSIFTSRAKFMDTVAPEKQEQAVAEREFVEQSVKDFHQALSLRLNAIMVPTYFKVSVVETGGIPKDTMILLVNEENIKPNDNGKEPNKKG